jgi:hypothetical protein
VLFVVGPEASSIMKKLTPEVLERAVVLITQLRSGQLDDAQQSDVVTELDALLPDPHWFGYAIDQVPELPAEAVVRRAFEYRPFLMPAPPKEAEP